MWLVSETQVLLNTDWNHQCARQQADTDGSVGQQRVLDLNPGHLNLNTAPFGKSLNISEQLWPPPSGVSSLGELAHADHTAAGGRAQLSVLHLMDSQEGLHANFCTSLVSWPCKVFVCVLVSFQLAFWWNISACFSVWKESSDCQKKKRKGKRVT